MLNIPEIVGFLMNSSKTSYSEKILYLPSNTEVAAAAPRPRRRGRRRAPAPLDPSRVSAAITSCKKWRVVRFFGRFFRKCATNFSDMPSNLPRTSYIMCINFVISFCEKIWKESGGVIWLPRYPAVELRPGGAELIVESHEVGEYVRPLFVFSPRQIASISPLRRHVKCTS